LKTLLHICCAPCGIWPLQHLRERGDDVMGFFYRHNIHPFTECMRREETLRDYAETVDLRVIYQEGYDLEGFLQRAVYRESDRCAVCYHHRLETTARLAKKGKFDRFTSTLLYSKFQNHELIRSMGESIGRSIGVAFDYHDFRTGWKEGIEASKKRNMYRQQYCGCIYSEKERYFREKNHGKP
jgi:predicted adenine nucleotide alpha hydrolase (AANH) superfamily ATPase